MFFHLNHYPRQDFWQESRKIAALALPMMVAQLTQVAMGFVDTVMSGRVSASDLAAVGLGSSIYITLYVTLIGVPTALNPILSQLFGAGEARQLAKETGQGLWVSVVLGVVAMLVMWLIPMSLHAFLTLDDYTVNTTALYIIGVSLGMPAALMSRGLQAYTAALNRPNIVMYMGIAGIFLNIPLNYILMHGLFGLPRLGGAGCGFATAAVMWFNAWLLLRYIKRRDYFKPYHFMHDLWRPQWASIRRILALGGPISFSFFLEVSLFSFIALLVANLGVQYVAAQQVVLVIASMLYVVPQSFGAASSVRVGQEVGSGAGLRARYVSGVSLLLGVVGALLTASILLFGRAPLLSWFTDDAQVIAVGLNLLSFAAIYQLADALQTIASGALRGYKVTTVPMMIHAFSFWCVGLGFGYYLAFGWDLGLYGFWIAVVLALIAAAVALTYYLSLVSRKKAGLC